MTLEEIGLAVVRIEGKLDLLASRNDKAEKDLGDHEARIRFLEQRSVVTTKMFWSGLVGITAFMSAVAELVYVLAQ